MVARRTDRAYSPPVSPRRRRSHEPHCKKTTKQEVADNLEQANKVFQGKRYKEAPGFYTHGIDSKRHDVGLRKVACDLELGASPPSLRRTYLVIEG